MPFTFNELIQFRYSTDNVSLKLTCDDIYIKKSLNRRI